MPVLGESIGGRYRLDVVIGRGGMSTVYRAFDTVLERPVAIKLMHPGVAADADQLERFRREARLVARLEPPPRGDRDRRGRAARERRPPTRR